MTFLTDNALEIAFALSVLINILQFLAPRTKTKVDDAILAGAEAVQSMLPKPPPKA